MVGVCVQGRGAAGRHRGAALALEVAKQLVDVTTNDPKGTCC